MIFGVKSLLVSGSSIKRHVLSAQDSGEIIVPNRAVVSPSRSLNEGVINGCSYLVAFAGIASVSCCLKVSANVPSVAWHLGREAHVGIRLGEEPGLISTLQKTLFQVHAFELALLCFHKGKRSSLSKISRAGLENTGHFLIIRYDIVALQLNSNTQKKSLCQT